MNILAEKLFRSLQLYTSFESLTDNLIRNAIAPASPRIFSQ